MADPAAATFFQGFETDTAGWFSATRVASGTHGVISATGAFHAEDLTFSDTFTRWGGYSSTFPPGGYITSVDIYLDITAPYMNGMGYANDTRFDWSSAINQPNCSHRRDFVFNAGFYTDTDTTGIGPRFVISASTNAMRSGAFPKNPGKDPFTIYLEGWYTFEHHFYDSGGGVLAVDLTIKKAGVPLKTWTRSDPTDIIGSTVGGNRYGWFVINEFALSPPTPPPSALAFDNSALVGFQALCTPPPSTPGAKITGGGSIPVAGGTATFGLTALVRTNGTPHGNLSYHDHAADQTVKSTAITSVEITGSCTRIFGTATLNGAGSFGFEVNACDVSEPGAGADTFTIDLSNGYHASGTLSGGNIQIH
jgi:hypothetical protein